MRAIVPLIASCTDRSSPYGTCQARGGFSASASGRPTPVRSSAGAYRGDTVVGIVNRRPPSSTASSVTYVSLTSTSLPGGRFPMLAWNTSGRSSSSRNAPSPRSIASSYSPERLLPLLHLPDDERAVDDGFEAADGRAFVERKHVRRLDGRRLAIHVALRHRDARAERRDLRFDRNAGERDGHGLGGEQSGVGSGRLVLAWLSSSIDWSLVGVAKFRRHQAASSASLPGAGRRTSRET